MAINPVDEARRVWKIGSDVPIVIQGGGTGQDFDEALKAARTLMPQLVGLDGVVRLSMLKDIEALLSKVGFTFLKVEPYNPPGEMRFYLHGRLLVRIKTKGNPPDESFRVNQPHLSVVLLKDVRDSCFASEMAKFTRTGIAQPRSMYQKGKNRYLQPTPPLQQKGETNQDFAKRKNAATQAWGNATHFPFASSVALLT